MTEARLLEVLESFRTLRMAVIGDACLDAYWYADMRRSELSRETPHYNRPVYREEYSCGAAGNVAVNLATLNVESVLIFTILGKDWRSEILLDILKKSRIDTSKIFLVDYRLTPAFIKPILEGFQVSEESERLDFLSSHPPESEDIQGLAAAFAGSLGILDGVLVGDQVLNGVVTPELVETINSFAAENRDLVFTVDSRYRAQEFKNMVWKLNDFEAEELLGAKRTGDAEETSRRLLDLGPSRVFLTLGGRGCVAAESGNVLHIPGFEVPPPVDAVGAGDAFHAIMAASLCTGCSLVEAAFLGNLAAAVTVAKVGTTGTASPGEILDLFSKRCKRGIG
jgi:rfaE bifunctional protein kinase chain/domain